jgi:hypothetical protein
MGRLIDADALLKHFEMIQEQENAIGLDFVAITDEIKEQPTAYDPDKVAERLKALTEEECTLHECGIRSEHCKACIAKKAIEIVKGGGVDERS